MKRSSKRLVAALLTVMMVLSLFVPASAAGAEATLLAADGFLSAAGDLESAYATWEAAAGVTSYTASVIDASGKETALADQLIRQYPGYMRVDALGLKAGTYKIKVTANTGASMTTGDLTVKAHDRSGYGFVGGTASGAYNEDGTLKSNAVVVYVTNDNFDTVTAEANGKTFTGVQGIVNESGMSKEAPGVPVCIRVLGTIDTTGFPSGSWGSSSEGLQVKAGSNKVKNLTIEGVGNDATFNGFGMLIRNCTNVEVRNLGFVNYADDGVSIDTDNKNLWVHNCDFFYGKAGSGDKIKGDGALDTKKSDYFTASYNHFWDCGKTGLVGGTKSDTQDYLTYHHNWYDHTDSRCPRIRAAQHIHIYNNYYDGVAKYGVGVAQNACAFVEANYFRNTRYPIITGKMAHDNESDGGNTLSGETGRVAKAWANVIVGAEAFTTYQENNTDFDAYVATSRDEVLPASVAGPAGSYSNFDTASDFYSYTPESAEDAVVTVTKWAGRVQGGDFQYKFNNDVEDKNYSVNTELRSAVTNYKGTLVKVGGQVDASASGSEHTHVLAWKVTVTPGCNKDTKELVEGKKVEYCTICDYETGKTETLAGQHSNDGSGTCTVCGKVVGTGGGPVVSGNAKTLKAVEFTMHEATGEKSNTATMRAEDMAAVEDGYFTLSGSGVNKRTKDGTTVGSKAEWIDLPKSGNGGIQFTVSSAPATVNVSWGNTGKGQTSTLLIKSSDGKEISKVDHTDSKSSSTTSTTVTLESNGTYIVASAPNAGYSVRLYTLSVSEDASTSTPSQAPSSQAPSSQTPSSQAPSSQTPSSQPPATVAVTGVKLNTGELLLRLSSTKTATLEAEISPSNATNKSVTWTSSNAAVATVANGVVTAVGAGTATITVKTADGNKTATCAVTVKAAAGSSSAGDAYVLTADDVLKALDPNHQEGKDFTATNKGPYTTADGFFTVYPKATDTDVYDGISIKAVTKWPAGDKSTATWSDGYKPTYALNNATGSSMTQSKDTSTGEVTARISNVVKFTVDAPATVKVWYLLKSDGDADGVGLFVADELAPVAKTAAESGAGKGTIASVDTPAAGTYYVGGVKGDAGAKIVVTKVEVTLKSGTTEPEDKPVTGVSLDKTTLDLHTETAKTGTLTATVAPADADEKGVTWSSSDEAVATVDQTGKVTAVGAGTATIIVTTKDGGFTKSCAVTVTAPAAPSQTPSSQAPSSQAPSSQAPSSQAPGSQAPSSQAPSSQAPSSQPPAAVAVTGVSLDKKSATVRVNGTVTLKATVTPANAANKGVYWTSSDTSVATVDQTGKVTGVKTGLATIVVRTLDGDKTATCAVEVTASLGGGGGGGGSTSGGGSSSAKPTTPPDTSSTTPAATLPFLDVATSAWFHDSVKRAFDLGLMKGVDATHFAPNASTTRAMVATVLFRLDGEKKTDVKELFEDVASGQWYTEAVAWASAKGVVKGYDADTFAPDDNVTREQLAVMLYRYAKAAKTDKDLSAFADAASVSDWATEAIAWAVDQGIITGKGGGILDPQGLASRAEICTMLVRFLDLKK